MSTEVKDLPIEKQTKIQFGRILGEMCRIQMRSGNIVCGVNKGQVTGLLLGIEPVIDEVLEETGFVSTKQFDATIGVLREYAEPHKLAKLTGFNDIEQRLVSLGVDRLDAIRIFTYLTASGMYLDVLKKFDSINSPSECRTFNPFPREM